MPLRRRLSLLAAALFVACTASVGYLSLRNEAATPERAFYYWRTSFELSQTEQRALSDLGVTKLYIRLFDVEPASDGFRSIAKLDLPAGALTSGLEVVPVVYLRNDVFAALDKIGVDKLAALVVSETQGATPSARELQLDCDWSDSTRERYFEFLRVLRSMLPADIELSATIRLHQVKFRERTGVPPVERGMLMFYNMGKFSAEEDTHAIFDAEQAELYLERLPDYPLPLDVALPIWSWTLQLRGEQVEGLLQSTTAEDVASLDFLRPVGPARFEVTRTTFLQGHLLRAGDQLKVEETGPQRVLQAATLLADHLGHPPGTVALFDLSEKNLRRHGLADLERVFEALR